MSAIEPADALLAIDVGNTRVGLGVWDCDGLHDTRRVSTARPEEWEGAVRETWRAIRPARRAVVLGSVNPRMAMQMQDVTEEVTGLSVLRIRDDVPLPMPMDIENPEEVGVDRVCAAAAAFERIGGACAVASFGTAITVDCVSSNGHFLGGAILPGIEMSFAALHTGAAQLPRVDLAPPTGAFGKNTHTAIANGVAYGALGALREIVERFAEELREWPQLVVTGGNAPFIAEMAEFVDSVVPDLCLMGIALAHRKAAGQA